MKLKPIDQMSNNEFEAILDQIEDNDPDRISASSFMETLWAIVTKNITQVIEITAKRIDDRVEIEAPDGVAVRDNELIVGNHRIIIHWLNP